MIRKIYNNADWLGKELQKTNDWFHVLNVHEIAELKKAMDYAKKNTSGLKYMSKKSFPLPRLSAALEFMKFELESGLGVRLIRGFPADRFTKDELRIIFWGIGLHLGTAVSQSKRNDFLGDVRDLGTGLDGPKFRGYTSNGELTFHSDAADITGLFCLQPAKKGGLSRVISSVAVHNAMLQNRPDLLEVLYQPFPWSMQGNELPGKPGFYLQPIFGVRDGYFACRYTRTHIRSAESNPEITDLNFKQKEALALLDELCGQSELALKMLFQPGDMQFLNNHLTLHNRTAYTDYGDEEKKRHLLRLWLSLSNGRPLPNAFKPFYRNVSAGAIRGGFPGVGKPRFTTT